MKFIDRSNIAEPRFYTNLLRAQLSNSELHLLFYNCLAEFGRRKFLPLVAKYDLLQNMPKDGLVQPWHFDIYSTTISHVGSSDWPEICSRLE